MQHRQRHRAFGTQPAAPAVARRVDAEVAQRAPHRPVPAVFDALRIAAHARCLPGHIAGEARDVIPVGIVRRHEDHRVVRGAAPSAAARGYSTPCPALYLGSRACRCLVLVVAHVKFPGQLRVLASEGMERRHVVVVGNLSASVRGSPPASTRKTRMPASAQPRRQHAATCARPHDDVVPFEGRVTGHVRRDPCQNVLRNEISARLSSSLSSGSLPKDLSSALRPSCRLNSAVPK